MASYRQTSKVKSGSGTVATGSVNMAYTHGDTVQITGSGFGTMPTFAFAGGSAGPLETTSVGLTPTSPANTSGPTAVTGFNWTRFATLASILDDSSRGKCIGYTGGASGGESSQEYRFPSTVPTGGKLMIKYYGRYSAVNSGGIGPQYKWARLQSGVSDIADTVHNAVFTYHVINGGNMVITNSVGGTGSDVWYPGTNALPNMDGVWRRVEKKIIAGTQGSYNGSYRIRAYSGIAPAYVTSSSVNNRDLQSQVMTYPDAERYIAYTWQNWWGNGFTNGTFAIDDHYVQLGSFACVEVWDTPDPATATKREIQEPLSWSDSSISVRLNKGGLSPGTYYIVVLADSTSDVVLASKQIRIL